MPQNGWSPGNQDLRADGPHGINLAGNLVPGAPPPAAVEASWSREDQDVARSWSPADRLRAGAGPRCSTLPAFAERARRGWLARDQIPRRAAPRRTRSSLQRGPWGITYSTRRKITRSPPRDHAQHPQGSHTQPAWGTCSTCRHVRRSPQRDHPQRAQGDHSQPAWRSPVARAERSHAVRAGRSHASRREVRRSTRRETARGMRGKDHPERAGTSHAERSPTRRSPTPRTPADKSPAERSPAPRLPAGACAPANTQHRTYR